jgi:hypothetical protein
MSFILAFFKLRAIITDTVRPDAGITFSGLEKFGIVLWNFGLDIRTRHGSVLPNASAIAEAAPIVLGDNDIDSLPYRELKSGETRTGEVFTLIGTGGFVAKIDCNSVS